MSALPWYRTITAEQWRVLLAAQLGWTLDAMDVVLYVMALNALSDAFGFGPAAAGGLATVTLLTSAAGGLLFGFVADRIGRARALTLTDRQLREPASVELARRHRAAGLVGQLSLRLEDVTRHLQVSVNLHLDALAALGLYQEEIA